MMLAKVYITLKRGVLDPQGSTIKSALSNLGFTGVEDVRVGKYMEIKLSATSREDAEKLVRRMCSDVLSNPVIEDYSFELTEV